MVEMACTTQIHGFPGIPHQKATKKDTTKREICVGEQLIVMLFLTTGLRIGGVARLQLSGPPPQRTADVPIELITTEKNNKARTIRPTACCRVLLARWYTHGRRTIPSNDGSSRYVFPSASNALDPKGRDHSVGTRHIWEVCRGLFQRAGLRGPHVHPHSFRHTVIHMLFMTGSTFENIAKWIGHSTPQVTSAVYGRLSQRDAEASLENVPFLASSDSGSESGSFSASGRYKKKATMEGWARGVDCTGAVSQRTIPFQQCRVAGVPNRRR